MRCRYIFRACPTAQLSDRGARSAVLYLNKQHNSTRQIVSNKVSPTTPFEKALVGLLWSLLPQPNCRLRQARRHRGHVHRQHAAFLGENFDQKSFQGFKGCPSYCGLAHQLCSHPLVPSLSLCLLLERNPLLPAFRGLNCCLLGRQLEQTGDAASKTPRYASMTSLPVEYESR